MFQKKQFFILIICLAIVGCGAGGGDLLDGGIDGLGTLTFNPSSLVMQLGSTTSVTLSLDGSGDDLSSYSFFMHSSDSGIVLMNPTICDLDSHFPPSCTINITAIGVGTTYISGGDLPENPLQVTVVDSPGQ